MHSGWIRQIGGNDPSEIIILAFLILELIYRIFEDPFGFVSDALSINGRKNWNLAEKLPQNPLFQIKSRKKYQKISIKPPELKIGSIAVRLQLSNG